MNNPFEHLPMYLNDLWTWTGEGDPDLNDESGWEHRQPAEHQIEDFEQALTMVDENPQVYGHVKFLADLDEGEVFKVWEALVNNDEYVRPDVLAIALAGCLDCAVDYLATDLSEWMFGEYKFSVGRWLDGEIKDAVRTLEHNNRLLALALEHGATHRDTISLTQFYWQDGDKILSVRIRHNSDGDPEWPGWKVSGYRDVPNWARRVDTEAVPF